MKNPFFSIKVNIKNIYFEQIYKSDKIIVPIGCDCHSAHILTKLHLKKLSLPFDRIGSKPETTLYYVMDCIKTNFSKAFSDFELNEEQRVVSRNYPNTRFTHFPTIISDKDVSSKFILRGRLMNELVEKVDIYYLCNIKITPFQKKDIADKLIQDIISFTQLIKPNDSLHIYFTSEDDKEENQDIREYLLDQIQNITKIKAVHYHKDKATYGIWGNTKYYPTLLKSLNINIKKSLKFKIYTSSRKTN